ncbi:MAG TPA: FMN-dependent NADH-azoreductase [Steroidobacteraceae bacterium]|nr:FMN-dependent NADH-azoreductase [Steroidobacteraceae bacterium]
MTTLLKINSSIHSDQGQSSRMADRFVAAWRERHPDARVVHRDLASEPVPHLTAGRFAALSTAPERRDAEQRATAAYSDALIGELQEADVIVLGLPMYNFGVPSMLKAYFDHVARAGITFKYSENGPQGLLTGKKAYVFAARGGRYHGTPLDTQSGYVRDFLRFLGVADVEFVYAEGLALSEDSKQAALSLVRNTIDELTRTKSAAA